MVMNFAVFDTNLHMIHHYKRVNAAKCVVNTSAPSSRQLRYKNVSNLNSRYSTPTLLSTSERIPSRANSNCEVRKRINYNVRLDITPTERSSSVPPRPCTRRNPKNVPQNFIKTRKPSPKILDNINAKKIPIHNENPVSSTASSPKHKPKLKHDKSNKLKVVPSKPPVPAPRHSFASPKKPIVQDYEYLQFSLRITEDIIRNDLYTQKEMRRVFNSHIEANRGRLNMTKMLKQIDHLCKELNISQKVSGNKIIDKENSERCTCKPKETSTIDKITESVGSGSTKSSSQTKESSTNSSSQTKESSSSENSKEDILNKVIDGQHEITEDEINDLTESDLQEVITKILNNDSHLCSVCKKNKEPQITAEIIEFTDETSKLNTSPVENDFAIIHTNIENFYSASAENFKTYSTSSGASVVSSYDTKHIEQEEQNVNYKEFACSCDDDKELKQKTQETFAEKQTKTNDPEIKADQLKALEAYDEILKTMLKKFPEKFDDDVQLKNYQDQLKKLDICTIDPICARKLQKEIDQMLSEDKIKNVDLCLLDPMCSGLQPNKSNEIDSKKSDNWSTLDSSAQETEENSGEIELSTHEQDLCLINSVCSTKKREDTEQNNCKDLCLEDPVCPGNKTIRTEQKSEHKNQIKSKESEKATSNVPSLIKEQIKSGDLYSLDPVCSKLKEQISTDVPTKEQNDSNDLCSMNPICSKLRANASEQTNTDIQSPTKEQNDIKDLCSMDPICSKLRANISEQTNTDIQSPTKEQNDIKDLCSMDPICSKLRAENKSEDLCPFDAVCSTIKRAKEFDQLISNVQSAITEQIENNNECKDLCSDDPICAKLRTKAGEKISSSAATATEEQINNKDFSSAEPICSKTSEQTSSNVEPPSKEQMKSKDLYSTISVSSKVKSKLTEQTSSNIESSIKEQMNSKDSCSVDSICSKTKSKFSEQTSSNVQPPSKEQMNSKDSCSTDSICSKIKAKLSEQTSSNVEPPSKEQIKSKDFCSTDPTCSKIKAKLNEQTSSNVATTKEQNPSKYLSADSTYSKLKSKASEQTKSSSTTTKEVSIVEQTRPVDNMIPASIKSIKMDSKITQTSFLATEKSESLTNTFNDDNDEFYVDNNSPSSSKKDEIKTVYDKNVDNKILQKEKEDFISSITKFILDKTFANVKPDSNHSLHSNYSVQSKYSVQSNYSVQSEKQVKGKSEFVSTVEQLVNNRTKDLYQYSVPDNERNDSESVYTLAVVADSLDKYRTEYREKYNVPLRKKSSKSSDSTISEGEISISSTNVSSVRRINQKIIRKQEPEILEHLKKYEQSKPSTKSNFLKPCVCDYEIKTSNQQDYDMYVPKFRRSMFFPAVATQTSNSDLGYKMRYNDNLLSDGEIQNNSSETDDSKISSSENEISSWR